MTRHGQSVLAPTPSLTALPRRRALLGGGLLLSGAAVALLSGIRPVGAGTADDAQILNTALGAELEAIAAYQAGAESGLLQPDILEVAVTFQGHHREHAELLRKTVAQLGGTPVQAKADYAFPLDALQSQEDVLRFAAGLEQGAVSAYLGAVPLFDEPELARAAASILGDEAMHWATLRMVLGEPPVPFAFVS